MPKIKMPARSFFDRTHDVKGDIDMGKMYPVLAEEINPGDTVSDSVEMLIRMSPMIRPILTEMTAYVRFFFVRDWTIFSDFEEMISKGPDGQSTVTLPMNGANYTVAQGSPEDWLRINPGVYDADQFNLMALMSYNKCYNDWYRPQNLVPDEVSLTDQSMKYTTWERDMFTNALPFVQRGPQVLMPLGTSAPVVTVATGHKTDPDVGIQWDYNGTGAKFTPSGSGFVGITTSGATMYRGGSLVDAQDAHTPLRPNNLVADLSAVPGLSMNDWRSYMQVQAWMELNALGGVRYPELVLAHFGVVTPDSRIERAEYLGSMKVPVVVSEVLQTSKTTEDSGTEKGSPQGNLAGHGIGANARTVFKRSFTEHGWIIGILTWVPKSGYQQGIPLEYQRKSALDFMWPLFTRLGMRDLPIKTLYTGAYLKDGAVVSPGTTGAVWTPVSDPNETFGYYTIYDELRYKSNSVHGKMRDSLAFWHLNRIFASKPTLSQTFVECHPDTSRIKAVTTESDGFVQIIHRLKAYRELPKNPTPWHF